jgi:hypothetical protein
MRRNEIAEGILRVASLAGFWGLIGEISIPWKEGGGTV